jgi:hypothetical protein
VRHGRAAKQCVWLGPAGYFCGCRRRITDAHTDSNGYSDRHSDSNCNPSSVCNANSNTYTDSNTNSHSYCYSDADACCEAHSATAASSYAAAQALIPKFVRRSLARRRMIGDQ